ncbi:NUDIX hydrolase [Micromonospora echinofusca]|uniref:NUDIX hydrolase n=1 Tax=Micromonospora echinofusca TaxID=47858 RepID=UPI003D9F2515
MVRPRRAGGPADRPADRGDGGGRPGRPPGLTLPPPASRSPIMRLTGRRASCAAASLMIDGATRERPGRRGSASGWSSGGGCDELGWFTTDEAAAVPLMPFTAELLDLPVSPLPSDLPRSSATEPAAALPPDRRQRFGAYGLVTDPAGRVLLTMIADGYPGAGRWHLPDGGTDHGEQPVSALLRELVEESGQLGRVVELVGVDNLHNPAALGPEGRPLDWHGVRVVYRVAVDVPTEPRVTELAGGSTARAAWFTPGRLVGLPLTEIAVLALAGGPAAGRP